MRRTLGLLFAGVFLVDASGQSYARAVTYQANKPNRHESN